jgi:hypothetical protein
MTEQRELRVGSYNLPNGGIDHGEDSRLRRQLRMLAGERLDVLGLQEATHWATYHLSLAADALAMTPYPARSSHHGCDLVLMVRAERVKVLHERHERGDRHTGTRWPVCARRSTAPPSIW